MIRPRERGATGTRARAALTTARLLVTSECGETPEKDRKIEGGQGRSLPALGEGRRVGKPDDGSDRDVHIWRIAPTRRDLAGFLGWAGVLGSIGVGSLAFVRMMYPRVLFEPGSRHPLGSPESYGLESVSEKWIKAHRLWLVRFRDRFVALSAVCTHLGCTPRYLATEDKFRCPCHGSGFRGVSAGWAGVGQSYEGPAPRPLERFELELDGGEIVVDTSKSYRIEKNQAAERGAFLPYA